MAYMCIYNCVYTFGSDMANDAECYAISEVSGDFMACGVYGQFIYISPSKNVVIAKNSAYHNYTNDMLPSKLKHVSFFRALAEVYGNE